MATMVLLAALTPAYAPPGVRAPPRPIEIRPSPQDEPGQRGDERQPGSRGSNRAAHEFKGWIIGSANEGQPVAEGLRPSRYLALLDIVRAHPFWSRIDITNWRFVKESPGAEEIYRVLELTNRPLPPPELAVFLDPILFKGARTGIAKAWSGRGPYVEMPAEASLLENFLKSYSGTTLLLVGHVEGDNFVMRDAEGKSVGSYLIPDLVSTARTQNVLLVPIGCRTGDAGAPFGFMQDISTDEVQAFLRAIPPGRPTVGDLLVALQSVAPLHIDISATRDVLEIAVFAPGNDNPSVRVQVPRSLPPPQNAPTATPSSVAQSQTLESFLAQLEALAPRYAWHDLAWGWISLVGFVVLAVGGYLDAAPSMRWFFRTRSRTELGRYLKVLGLAAAWLGLIITSASMIYFLTTQWIVGCLIVTAVIGLFFAGAWTRSPRAQDATP